MSPKPVKFEFYSDENFPIAAGKFLKSLGHSVKFTSLKNKGLSDLDQIKIANKNKRIFISLDKDFKSQNNLLGTIRKGLGVILVSSSLPVSDKIIEILKRHIKKLTPAILKGKICRISDSKIIYY